MYCLLKATHSDHKQLVGKQFVELKPGQFVFGRKKAALELNMKESTVRDYIELLKQDNSIQIESTNKYSVITIVNWGFYQGEDDNNQQQNDSKMTAKRQQNDTNKNDKNEKNDKEEKILSEIENLRIQFSSDVQGLLKKYWNVIKKTRKTKTISNSVILKTMKKWTKYDDVVIQFALKTHIENYDDGERDEKYTLGIMRRTSKEEAFDRLNKVVRIPNKRYEPDRRPRVNHEHLEYMERLMREADERHKNSN